MAISLLKEDSHEKETECSIDGRRLDVFHGSLLRRSGGDAPSSAGDPTQSTPVQGSPSQGGQSVHKDTLTVALYGEPDNLNPYGQSHEAAHIANNVCYERLIRKDLNGEIIPWLATEWEMTDDVTLHLVLRDDVTFHNGSKFTAEDVAYSLTCLAESSFTSNLFGSIDTEAFDIVSDYELNVKLQYPNAAFIEALASTRGLMVSKDYFENGATEDINRKPMGTGPMMFKEWVTGDHYSFTAYKGYWGDALAYDNVNFRFITESSSRCIELETGGVDIAQQIAFSDWDRIEANPDTNLVRGQTLGTRNLCFNMNQDFLKDINVRKALAYAIDLETLVKVVWEGTCSVAAGYYSPEILGYKAVGPQEYNPELAKEYLARAGYTEANPLKFNYYTYENTVNITFAEVLQQMWSEVGIQAEVKVTDLSSFTTMNNNAELTVSLLSTTAAIPDPTAVLLIWPTTRTISIRHNDQHVQDLLDQAVSSYDPAEREATYGELQSYLWEQFYAFPVCHPQEAYGCRSNVQNLPFYPNLVMELDRVTFSE